MTELSAILCIRPRGIEPMIDAVLWPEDQTPAAEFVCRMRTRLNPDIRMVSVKFPPGTTRETAKEFLSKASSPDLNKWLRSLYNEAVYP